MHQVKNPHEACQKVYDLVKSLTQQLIKKCNEPNANSSGKKQITHLFIRMIEALSYFCRLLLFYVNDDNWILI